MKIAEVNILGTTYEILRNKELDDPKLKNANGYYDHSTKQIVVCDFVPSENDVGDLKQYEKKVLRHEVVHAFLYESGIWNNTEISGAWALNEEMVDWFAIQGPKIYKVWEELELI